MFGVTAGRNIATNNRELQEKKTKLTIANSKSPASSNKNYTI